MTPYRLHSESAALNISLLTHFLHQRFSMFTFYFSIFTILLKTFSKIRSNFLLALLHFQEYMKVMRLTNPSVRAIVEEIERDEIVRWSNSLTRARVSRWGGMISTPDEYLQVNDKY